MSSTPSLAALRDLRKRVRVLSSTLTADLRPFLHADGRTFRPLPNSRSRRRDVSVATTATAYMSMIGTSAAVDLFGAKVARDAPLAAFTRIANAAWDSAGLPDNNPFTQTMVLRALGMLRHAAVLSKDDVLSLRHRKMAIADFANKLSADVPESFRPDPHKYPATPALGFWLVDALANLDHRLTSGRWRALTDWTTNTFRKQYSLVTATNFPGKDPVAMAMAAALCARLRRIFTMRGGTGLTEQLPLDQELRQATRELFEYQQTSGIWPRYFPLFEYPKTGANYCFTFEFLEALLLDVIDADLIDESLIFEGLAKAVSWCERFRLTYPFDGQVYKGWHSGGQLDTLARGVPEAWATGVVHMFLRSLDERLSQSIQRIILRAYDAQPAANDPGIGEHRTEEWDSFIDLQINVQDQETTVKTMIEWQMISPLNGGNLPLVSHTAFKLPRAAKRSALLFGPPGTSKTSFVGALARLLGWPLVTINPAHFLADGLERIHVRTNVVFDDLSDLSRVVVIFDEMDALVQRRENELDVTRQFLTTAMLPKLADLYRGGRVLFFVATNHQSGFDEAIKRSGRFDLLVFMPPPPWRKKIANLKLLVRDLPRQNLRTAAQILRQYVRRKAHVELLDRFSFGEMKAFFAVIQGDQPLQTALRKLGRARFLATMENWAAKYITLRDLEDRDAPPAAPEGSNKTYQEYLRDRSASRIQ
jgi:hypothetical protein